MIEHELELPAKKLLSPEGGAGCIELVEAIVNYVDKLLPSP